MKKRRVLLAGCSIASCLAGAAWAQGQSKYEKTPTGDDMVTYYPKKAMDLGVEGRAVIDCVVKPDHTLTSCSISSETPDGYEFGAAAIKLSVLFRMKNDSGQAEPGSHVQVPINFRLAGSPQSAEVAMLGRLRWARQPSPDDLEAIRPAVLSGEGVATLRCHVRSAKQLPAPERGTLYDCESVKEAPAKIGLGKAAQTLAPKFQFEGASLPVLPTKYTVDIDVTWAPKSADQANTTR